MYTLYHSLAYLHYNTCIRSHKQVSIWNKILPRIIKTDASKLLIDVDQRIKILKVDLNLYSYDKDYMYIEKIKSSWF